jgi:hypothetical protein
VRLRRLRKAGTRDWDERDSHPKQELKRNTRCYGVQCICRRLLALGEDSFAGDGEEHHVSALALEVLCECGAVSRTQVLHMFKTP